MRVDEGEPGQVLEPGSVVVPRVAVTVMVVRDGPAGLEVLLVRRTPAARFMGGAWVFPGGAVDAGDGGGDPGRRAAGLRELTEETGIAGVSPDGLVPFSRWITPEGANRRFDTWFFVVVAPDGADPQVDGEECVDAGWFAPAVALERYRSGGMLLVFPTIKHLEELATHADTRALVTAAAGRDVRPVQPRLVTRGAETHVVLPGEPGYDDA